MNQIIKNIFSILIIFNLIFLNLLSCYANEGTTLKGFVTNKSFKPISLKVDEIEKQNFWELKRNLEDGSLVPTEGLQLTTQSTMDYSLFINDTIINIPKSTKFVGQISEVVPSKKFGKRGFYRVDFDKAICPGGEVIPLKASITSKSELMTYSPAKHVGKATLGLIGGGLLGALFTYKLGGLGLAIATEGYSIAAGAALGGFLGTVGGIVSKGKEATIEPGDEVSILPVDEVGVNILNQVSCKLPPIKEKLVETTENVDLEILKVKQKKNFFGDLIKIDIKFANNSNEKIRFSNFCLRDSQGKEYTPSIIDVDSDPFIDVAPNRKLQTRLEFVVEYPKTSHWLVLKDRNFSRELGKWKVKE